MNTLIIEIHPRKAAFDPLAQHVRAELIEAGLSKEEAAVQTTRLYSLKGEGLTDVRDRIAETLLVDPVTETHTIQVGNGAGDGAAHKGCAIDVWPKPGVTDPVGETVEKGLRDLGLAESATVRSGIRYLFPKVSNTQPVERAAASLANPLIHDIIIRTHRPI